MVAATNPYWEYTTGRDNYRDWLARGSAEAEDWRRPSLMVELLARGMGRGKRVSRSVSQ